ncbi:hypothetical protein ACUXST_000868 [Sphingomonas sp. F9_3S_D5_B_2]
MKFFSKLAAPNEAETPKPDAEEKPAKPRSYTVGWLLQVNKTSVIWDAPQPFKTGTAKNPVAKSVAQCPAVLDFDRRYFVINCPIDLHLRLSNNKGELGITNMLFDKSPIRPNALSDMVVFQPQEEWRDPTKPVLQMMTSYIFVSDHPIYVNQYPPFLNYNPVARPGVQINGRFPIDIWPRALQWAFEWHDMSKDLVLKRGEPLFYVHFEGPDPSAPVRMIEAKKTPELVDYIDSITGVTEYVSQTYSLFKNARERRPERLLYPKE